MILFLLGCERPPCPVAPSFFTPDTEPLVILSGTGGFTLDGGAQPLDGYAGFTGPGRATTSVIAGRGTTYRIVYDIEASEPSSLVVRFGETADDTVTIAETEVSGAGTLDVTPVGAGRRMEIVFASDGVLRIDDFRVEYDEWAEVDDPPGGTLQLGMLVHVEDIAEIEQSSGNFSRRAVVLERLAETLASHEAKLTYQVDVTFAQGVANWDPAYVDRVAALGGGWSSHIHNESEGDEAVEAAARDAAVHYREIGVEPTDINGGFQLALYERFAAAGYWSMSAFKDPGTQAGLPRDSVVPWRPRDGTGTDDVDAFLVHDDEGPLVYLGGGMQSEPAHDRVAEVARRRLSQLLAHAVDGEINTAYLVTHVDFFSPLGDDDADWDAYIDDGRLDADLAHYDAMLSEVVDPLVDSGHVRWATSGEMGRCFRDREVDCGRVNEDSEGE
ncbi:MAG: hypothetical protein FJ102_03070 [Deltaproteobacteria bacterium]|nr:hypothetical protein [Deltaproteobacteria bacterium]